MTKIEYLNQLQKYLKRLPKQDYENTMDYFEEYFNEIGDENVEQAIRELGTPKEAASELLNQLLDTRLMDDKRQKKSSSIGRNILTAMLVICAAPVGGSLLIAALALVLAGIVLMVCTLLCGFILCLSILIIALKLLARGILAMTVSIPGALMIIGGGILGVGCSILFFVLVVYICRWIGKGIMLLARKISGRARR